MSARSARRAIMILTLSVIALTSAACQGGSNLPSISRTFTPSERPTRTDTTSTSTEPSTETATSTATSPAEKSSKPAAGSADTSPSSWWWLWALVALVVIVVVVLLIRRASSRRAAAGEAAARALQAYTDGMALRDIAAVMPMAAVTDRPRLFAELTSKL